MKRIIAIILSCALILSGCGQNTAMQADNTIAEINKNDDENETIVESEADNSTDASDIEYDEAVSEENDTIDSEPDTDEDSFEYGMSFESLDDENLHQYIEESVYNEIVAELDSDEFFVENVNAIYVSQEYIDELTYNSRPNIYFGYTLEEINKSFQGTRYVFTVNEVGDTVVVPFEDYDDTYEQVIKNVAIGTGVILVCVVVAVVTEGTAVPAEVSMFFAAAAKTGTEVALCSGALGGVAAGTVTGMQTGDVDKAIKAAALNGSESFKWGAISGAVAGGVNELVSLKGATLNGLTVNEAATIQKESKYPLEVIKEFHSPEEYAVFKEAGLKNIMVNNKSALVRGDIDLLQVDDNGITNLVRMQKGLAPLDTSGKTFELHHVGQNADGTLAILTSTEHDAAALHGYKAVSEIDRVEFSKQRKAFWMAMADLLEKGGI